MRAIFDMGDVIDAHRNEVDANRVMPVQVERELELGADAVGVWAAQEGPGARYIFTLVHFVRDFVFVFVLDAVIQNR